MLQVETFSLPIKIEHTSYKQSMYPDFSARKTQKFSGEVSGYKNPSNFTSLPYSSTFSSHYNRKEKLQSEAARGDKTNLR